MTSRVVAEYCFLGFLGPPDPDDEPLPDDDGCDESFEPDLLPDDPPRPPEELPRPPDDPPRPPDEPPRPPEGPYLEDPDGLRDDEPPREEGFLLSCAMVVLSIARCCLHTGSVRDKGRPTNGETALILGMFGNDLLSRGPSAQVPSALAVLTSVFGMGTGGTLPLWSPKLYECSLSTP